VHHLCFYSWTDAGLKEKLKKIISSDFFTATPEMKAPVEVAAAVGQLHLSEGSTVPSETAEGDIVASDDKVISHMLPITIFAFVLIVLDLELIGCNNHASHHLH
jgi:hypothetical protein